MSDMWVVVMGNPLYGFHITGPFGTLEEAEKWADAQEWAAWPQLVRPSYGRPNLRVVGEES